MRRSIAAPVALAALAGLAGTAGAQDDATYRAELKPMNAEAAGSEARGTATFGISDGQLAIRVEAEGTPPGMMHLQHFHGFPEDGRDAACPAGDADANGDGIVDLIETEPVAGRTMVPFHEDPVSMEIVADSYPTAGEDGAYSYMVGVSHTELREAFGETFAQAGDLDLTDRVVFIHGVPEDAELPDSVQSLGDVPAHVTLPIACGEIERVEG